MELSLADVRELFSAPTSTPHVFQSGETLFIRTVTYHLTGRVKRQVGIFLELEYAAWIADSGRFSDALKNGELNEVEPVDGIVRVNLLSVTDIFEWKHPLPRVRK